MRREAARPFARWVMLCTLRTLCAALGWAGLQGRTWPRVAPCEARPRRHTERTSAPRQQCIAVASLCHLERHQAPNGAPPFPSILLPPCPAQLPGRCRPGPPAARRAALGRPHGAPGEAAGPAAGGAAAAAGGRCVHAPAASAIVSRRGFRGPVVQGCCWGAMAGCSSAGGEALCQEGPR